MLILTLGIVLFLGVHIFAAFRTARARLIGQLGPGPHRALHSVIAFAGLVLIVWGFAHYRAAGVIAVWSPPDWMHYVSTALMWLAFVSLACTNPAPGRIRGWVRHPMLTAVTIWAAAHLISNGDAGGLLLFGSFFLWAIYDRIAVTRRGDPGAAPSPNFTRADAMVLSVGTLVFAAMLFLHPFVFGVPRTGQ